MNTRNSIVRHIVLVFVLGLALALLVPMGANAAGTNVIVNGGFETGDFSGWTNAYTGSMWCCTPSAWGIDLFGLPAPEGAHVASSGFDGDGPSEFHLYQDVTIPAGSSATLSFSYNIAASYGGLPRTLDVQFRDPSSNAVLANLYNFTAPTGSTNTGWVTQNVDVSAFTCQTVRVFFLVTIPESFTGPARAAYDNVSLTTSGSGGCGAGVETIAPVVEKAPDDRLNWKHGDTYARVYIRQDESGSAAVHLYCLDNTEKATIALVVTVDDVKGFAEKPAQNTLVKQSELCNAHFYILTTGEYQINVGPDFEGKHYVYIFVNLEGFGFYFKEFNTYDVAK